MPSFAVVAAFDILIRELPGAARAKRSAALPTARRKRRAAKTPLFAPRYAARWSACYFMSLMAARSFLYAQTTPMSETAGPVRIAHHAVRFKDVASAKAIPRRRMLTVTSRVAIMRERRCRSRHRAACCAASAAGGFAPVGVCQRPRTMFICRFLKGDAARAHATLDAARASR